MSIQSSINQILGNVGLLANTFQFQNQINHTEALSSQVAQLNEQKPQLEADKEQFTTESDEERANIEKKRSKLSRDKDYYENYFATIEDKIDRLWKQGFNPYAAGNDMASNMAQQRVDAARENIRKNQFEALQKAFNNIGMGGGNDNG